MTFTNEQLLDTIRGADSLEELQRMVGPSEEESQRNKLRNRTLDSYQNRVRPRTFSARMDSEGCASNPIGVLFAAQYIAESL